MLLAQPPTHIANPHSHSRRRPKLSLNIAPVPMNVATAPSRTALLSPTSRNTAFNARPNEWDSSSSASSSSGSEDDAPMTPRRTKRMSAFQPMTPGTGFATSISTRRSGRRAGEERRVQFKDDVVVIERDAAVDEYYRS